MCHHIIYYSAYTVEICFDNIHYNSVEHFTRFFNRKYYVLYYICVTRLVPMMYTLKCTQLKTALSITATSSSDNRWRIHDNCQLLSLIQYYSLTHFIFCYICTKTYWLRPFFLNNWSLWLRWQRPLALYIFTSFW